MRKNRTLLSLFSMIGICAMSLPARAQQDGQGKLDYNAVERTHVPHLRSSSGGGGGANPNPKPGGGGGVFGGTPYTVGLNISATTSVPAAEEHIAADPSSSNNLVAAISDFSLRGGSNTTKYAFSLNNGSSWAENFVPIAGNGLLDTGDGLTWPYNSDPVVAIDRAGNVFLTNLYFGNGNDGGLYVSRANLSAGPAFGFTAAQTSSVAVHPDPSSSTFEDKQWIAVDNSSGAPVAGGNVYVSWTRFVGNSDMIMVSRSTDHAQTWSTPVQLSPSSQNGAVQGSAVAVGPGGEVYVTWEVFYIAGVRRLFLAKSTDGGASFGAAAQITDGFSELSFNSTYRKNSFPALAVSPTNGNVYIVYSAQVKNKGAEVRFIRSTNGGASFSSPVGINDVSSGQQFFPAITVDGGGVIHVSFFDTRNSPNNSAVYDVYATRSLDNGTTWSPNARVTPTSVNAGSASFIGDYAGIAAGGGFAHPVWTSGGFNGGLLKTATLN